MWYLFDRIIFSVKFIPLQRWIVDSNIGKLHGLWHCYSRKPLGEKSLALKEVQAADTETDEWKVLMRSKTCEIGNAGLEIILRVFFLCFSGGERKEEKRKILPSPIFYPSWWVLFHVNFKNFRKWLKGHFSPTKVDFLSFCNILDSSFRNHSPL